MPDLPHATRHDRRVGLRGKKPALQTILAENARFVGAAPHQVDAFVAEVKPLAKRHKGAAEYQPARLLYNGGGCPHPAWTSLSLKVAPLLRPASVKLGIIGEPRRAGTRRLETRRYFEPRVGRIDVVP